MDPRIRERRVAVQRDAGRRRLRLLLAGGAVVGSVALAYGLTRSPVFDVDELLVLGAAKTTRAQIADVGGLDGSPQLADVKPAIVAHGLERLPWVQEARVVRHWPGTVEVTLVERMPLATVPASDGGWALVDETGRVLETTPGPTPGMVQVNTVPAPAPGAHVGEATLGALGLLNALPPSLSERVNGLTVSEDGLIEIHAVGLPIIHFGPASQMRSKLVALTTLVARTNLRGVKAIDVRVPTAPVLTRG
ncbi:MAG TPA: FtsQ-type POTRA domain-containing protein [Acidimicrobiales bacterium]|nr:FtsQ-type POTRA domain-containing protein [Acidimicrobiales bacterium]